MPWVQMMVKEKGWQKREGGRKREKGVEGARLGENGEGGSHRQRKMQQNPRTEQRHIFREENRMEDSCKPGGLSGI